MMPGEPNGLLWLYMGSFAAFFWTGLGFWLRYLMTLDVMAELRPNPADVADEVAEVDDLMLEAMKGRAS